MVKVFDEFFTITYREYWVTVIFVDVTFTSFNTSNTYKYFIVCKVISGFSKIFRIKNFNSCTTLTLQLFHGRGRYHIETSQLIMHNIPKWEDTL